MARVASPELECQRLARFEKDENGRPTAIVAADAKLVIPGEILIFSVGQRVGLGIAPADSDTRTTAEKTVEIDARTMATGRAGVFAAGDCTSGTAFAIEAIAGGHRSAQAIHRYLRGGIITPDAKPALPVAALSKVELDAKVQNRQIVPAPRVSMPEMAVASRRGDFVEVELGYSEAQARAEAARCLQCGLCSECLACVRVCGANAINHDDVERTEAIEVGAVILTPGYQAYNARQSQEFGFGRFPNVVTSLQFERLLSASGPTGGHVTRPSDGAKARKIAFLQCVGSRDKTHDYCSAVCCMYAAKEAVMAKEHEPDTEVHVFMMDTRAFSKSYEEYYRRAREKYGVHYHRCRISAVAEDPVNHDLVLRYGSRRRTVRIVEEAFDLVVLSVGMEISPGGPEAWRAISMSNSTPTAFARTSRFDPLQTSRPGIYAAGPFRQPKDIPETVVEASAAAGQAAAMLVAARGALARERVYPPERRRRRRAAAGGRFRLPLRHEHRRLRRRGRRGRRYARALPNVAHAEDKLYACSQDFDRGDRRAGARAGSQPRGGRQLHPAHPRAVVPGRHPSGGPQPLPVRHGEHPQPMFVGAFADRARATRKAKELVRMSVARVDGLEALDTLAVPIERSALVIGGGPAGMTAALALAEQGFPVDLARA